MDQRRLNRIAVVAYLVLASLGGALFPRAAHLARWPRRARGRPLVIYVLVTTALTYAVKYVLPERIRAADRIGPMKADLRAELGREPTVEELVAEYAKRHGPA